MYNFSDVVSLVTTTYAKDELGQEIGTDTLETVFCNVKSIPQNEFFNTAKQNIKACYVLIVKQCDYSNQTKVIYNSNTYHVYRTYMIDNENIELYVEEKGVM